MDYRITWILHFLLIANVYTQQFFNTMPPPVNTNFTCRGRDTGFYADVETNCRVYHTCDENGNKFTYYCPAETAFRQEALVCDHAHLVDCTNGRRISSVEKIVENKKEDIKHRARNNGRYTSAYSSRVSSLNDDERIGEKHNEPSQPASSNSAYTRSFKIPQERRSQFSTPRTSNQQQPTFVLSSSVFLRDRATSKNIHPIPAQNKHAGTSDNLKNFTYSERLPEDGEPEKKKESSQFFSSLSTTTLPALDADFQVKQYFRDPIIFRSSTLDQFEASTKSDTDNSFSTTPKIPVNPFGQNYRFRGNNNAEAYRFDKSKSNYENNGKNDGNVASHTGLDYGKINFSKAPTEFQNDEKRLRDKKIESSNNYRGNSMTGAIKLGSENRGRNQEGVSDFSGNMSEDSTFYKNRGRTEKNPKEGKISVHERPPFFHDNENFPYSETLRSMQVMTDESSTTTTTFSPPTTAGTEFPVHSLVGTFSSLGPNELDDDPYYPKRSTTTEIYYRLDDPQGEGKKSLRFSTKRPWPGSLNFEIPEVLPDLNTLDDLVDRRKYFFIPRIKAT